MDLSREISSELWESISTSYRAGHFSNAIVDTMHVLSDALRNKSGLDGDGTALVGQALGGESPRLRVNNMQTESERNVQRGLEQMLRGLYLGIRNPRSHDKHDDKKETADAIIVFVNYLLGQLEATKEAFTPAAFLESVRDPEFVDSSRYAELLVKEIPAMRRADALLAIYKDRLAIDLKRATTLIRLLISQLSDQQIATYLAEVSDDLRTSRDDVAIRTTLQMLTPDLWPRLEEVCRLRIENKLIKVIEAGKAPADGKLIGALGTWAGRYLKAFTSRDQAQKAIGYKMMWGDVADRNYVSRYFMWCLPEFMDDDWIAPCVGSIAIAIREGEEITKRNLVEHVGEFPDAWQQKLAEALADLTDAEKPAVTLRNGAPLLSKEEDDDIPF